MIGGPAVAAHLERFRRPTVLPGWPLALAAMALALATVVGLAGAAEANTGMILRGSAVALVVLAVGLVVGAEIVVGLAALPLLAVATIGLDRPTGLAWGPTLLVALAWYATTELAWAAIEARDGTVRSPAVARLRFQDGATVVGVAAAVGAAGAIAATVAPDRTAVVRGGAIAAILVALVALANKLRATDPASTDEPTGGTQP
jgi:hypothetical protein